MSQSEYQNKLKKVIHVAKRELGMTDEDYRSMLSSIPALEGATSTAKLTIPKLQAVLDAMKLMGFKVRPNKKTAGKPHNFDKMAEPITKIEALLADMQLPWSYADRISSQMFGIKRCAWLKDRKKLSALIAALHVEQEKRSLEATVLKLLNSLDTETKHLYEKELPVNWNRKRSLMKALIEKLAAEVES
jgi:phage gp16-like protein